MVKKETLVCQQTSRTEKGLEEMSTDDVLIKLRDKCKDHSCCKERRIYISSRGIGVRSLCCPCQLNGSTGCIS